MIPKDKKINLHYSEGQGDVLLEGFNMFDGVNLSLISDVDQDKQMFGSHERSLLYRCINMYVYRYLIYHLGDETKISTQWYIQLNTGVKEIQQFNPGELDHRHNIRP